MRNIGRLSPARRGANGTPAAILGISKDTPIVTAPGRPDRRTRRSAPGKTWLGTGALLAALALSMPAHAIYKCVDPGGKVTYQDDVCPKGASERQVEGEARRGKAKAAVTEEAPDEATKRPGASAAPSKPRDADESTCTPMDVHEVDAERSRSAARTAITMRVKGADNVRFERFVHARLKCADGMREFACGKASARDASGKFDEPKTWLFALTPESYLTWTEDERSDAQNTKRMAAAAAACFKFGV